VTGARLLLIAASDDYLLEEARSESVSRMAAELGGCPVETLAPDTTPESAAIELLSPSLFDPQRVLVVEDARAWVKTSAPGGAVGKLQPADAAPLVETLRNGLPDGVGLVLGVWCGSRPTGPLVDAIHENGEMQWIPSPPAPMPWEDVALSAEQVDVLKRVLHRAAPEVEMLPAAEELLLERLGFAPRRLVQEVRKLAAACGGDPIDEQLVRRLTFPRERSLEQLQQAVLGRRVGPFIDLMRAASDGVPVADWRGQRLESSALQFAAVGQGVSLATQMLYLLELGRELGLGSELDPERVHTRWWYSKQFKNDLAPRLLKAIAADPAAPWSGRKPPTVWKLGQLIDGAVRYRPDELARTLADAGGVEERLRGSLAGEAVSAWVTALLAP
jgi:hypothetical protein